MGERVRRAHGMPFGAEVRDGAVRFRLWAPDARDVVLLLGEGGPGSRDVSLISAGAGWWEREVAAAAGEWYRYRIDGVRAVPDPASRHQPHDVHGPSEIIDPRAFAWSDGDWRGPPWEEAVLYELHPGAFTPQGGFDGVRERLDALARLGVTAVQLMPVADFPGRRNWGYDGVLPFAPDASYGRPEALKRLVDAAHERGLMIFLDVVYNHFGPEGNYLQDYARPFFSTHRRTPWGDAINLDGENSAVVRDFFIHNALYWLEEYHFDGLRIDAVHALHDESEPCFLDELARRVREGPGAERHVHLVLENVANEASRLERDAESRPCAYVAQWNDDTHHALHCAVTGESGGYYADFAADPVRHLGRALAEGFAWQGERSSYHGRPRGEPSTHLPPTAFVNFLQNHDQVGNRAFGERLTVLAGEPELRAVTAVLLLSPAPPLLFMGQEMGSRTPFPFFCDFGPELARAVTEGRRREFDRFPEFRDPAVRQRIPDPNDPRTFESARLEWDAVDDEARAWLDFHHELLALRRREIVPRLRGCRGPGRYQVFEDGSLRVEWRLGDGSTLTLLARLGSGSGFADRPAGRILWPAVDARDGSGPLTLDSWDVRAFLLEAG